VLGVEQHRDVRDVGSSVELPDGLGAEAIEALQNKG
jgi:hypothetical protein